MAEFENRYPLNVPGKFYVDDQCTDCDLCRECAPNNVRRDDRMGFSYVHKQPENESEIAGLMEGVEGCPTDAVGADGDEHDWETEPIRDWNALAETWNTDVSFDVSVPVIPYQESLEQERVPMEKWKEENKKPWWRRLFS